MKGQITLEYLVISLVALVLLSIAFTALFKIKEMSDASYELIQFKGAVERIHSASKELCALGDGNSREIDVVTLVKIEMHGDNVKYSHGDHSIVRKLDCNLNFNSVEGEITLRNMDGNIEN